MTWLAREVLCFVHSSVFSAFLVDYIVEKCEEGTNVWEKVPGHVSGTAHNVKGLKEGKKYKFRVKAENVYGVSEPLVSDLTLAKNPYGKTCTIIWEVWDLVMLTVTLVHNYMSGHISTDNLAILYDNMDLHQHDHEC